MEAKKIRHRRSFFRIFRVKSNAPAFLLAPLVMFFLGWLIQSDYFVPDFELHHARKTQRIISHKETKLLAYLELLQTTVTEPALNQNLKALHTANYASLKKEGLSYFIFRNDSIVYWSDNEVPETNLLSAEKDSSFLIKLDNGWYVGYARSHQNYKLVGLMLIRHLYDLENNYLSNTFQVGLQLPPSVKFSSRAIEGSFPIYGQKGNFLFALVFEKNQPYSYQTAFPAILFLAGFVLLLFFLGANIRLMSLRNGQNGYIMLLIALLFGIKYLLQYYHIPESLYSLEIFQPDIFASSSLFPSLGDLFLWSVLTVFVAIMFHGNYHFPTKFMYRHHFFTLAVLCIFGGVGMFMVLRNIIGQLVLNSTLFTPQSPILLASGAGLVCMLILLMLLLSFALIADKIIGFCLQKMTWKIFGFYLLLTLTGYSIVASVNGYSPGILLLSGLTLVALYVAIIRKPEAPHYSYPSLVSLLIIFSLLTVALITNFAQLRLNREMELRVGNLSSLHDPVAEYLLINMDEKIRSDSMLSDLAVEATMSPEKQSLVTDYLRRNYFYGYLADRYDIQSPVCRPMDNITVLPDNQLVNCVDFFTEMYQNNGIRLPRNDIWFIDNLTGQSSYLSWYLMDSKALRQKAFLFIKLDAWITLENIGYPELLLDERTFYSSEMKGFSYAKYHKGRLMAQNGAFKYNLTSDVFEGADLANPRIKYNGYLHLVFRPTASDIIVLSTKMPRFINMAIFFAYFFVSFFLLLSVASFIKRRPRLKHLFVWNFKNKIQYSMMLILMISFIGIGVGTVIYVITQYQKKQSELLREKMQSIYAELSSTNLSDTRDPAKASFLTDELIRLSNIFLVDINLYSPSGRLIASSRPEIYDRGLIGRQIHPNAFEELTQNQNVSLIQEESIGNMKYMSAYRTIVSENNETLAYLNLPHFTQQVLLLDEITNVVVTVVNVALIVLLITFAVSVIISNTITLPLRLIQEKFRGIRLEGGNEKIRYDRRDEIGGLVQEYNSMVDELALSAQKLATSERELAWREMAKQVAHEINNSLTPMKVHIQYLQRAWQSRSDKFDKYMTKTPDILLEQIDTLSSIAKEFSHFAKMPVANLIRVEIISCIHNTVILFASDNVAFKLNFHGHEKIFVYADREQMLRVFVNLFKNAIQARSEDREPVIEVDIVCRSQKAYIRVRDNGIGIPDEMREKIFRPNFTTKTSGSGIGLAIVMSVVHSIGGSIKLYSKLNVGSSFLLIIPMMDRNESELPDEDEYEASLK